MTVKQARITPKANFSVSTEENYEIRLIIWEVVDIPLGGNET